MCSQGPGESLSYGFLGGFDSSLASDFDLISEPGAVRRLCVYDRQAHGWRTVCAVTELFWFNGDPWLCKDEW